MISNLTHVVGGNNVPIRTLDSLYTGIYNIYNYRRASDVTPCDRWWAICNLLVDNPEYNVICPAYMLSKLLVQFVSATKLTSDLITCCC